MSQFDHQRVKSISKSSSQIETQQKKKSNFSMHKLQETYLEKIIPTKEILNNEILNKYNQQQQYLQKESNHLRIDDDHIKLKKQYYDFFKDIISDPQNYIPQMPSDEDLKKHKIKYLKGNYFYQKLHSYDQPYIRIKNTQRQGTIVNYIVIIGMFQLEITLLNINQNANLQKNKIGSGSFGSVRIQSQNKRMFAVKRQMFMNKYNLEEFNMMANKYEINQLITELAIYKICSLLKIGPAAETQIGFDLICYKDCLEFQIQYCMGIEYNRKKDDKIGIYVDESKFEKQIKQCLLTLHFYRIIHKDIKPANILFSITYNKYVLTDFGISQPIGEKIGYPSETHCQGTGLYMSKQMRKIGKGKTGFVHLYGNDVYSLQLSLRKQMIYQNIEKALKQFKSKVIIQQNLKYQYEYLKLKYYCIKPDSKMEEMQKYWIYMNNIRRAQLVQIVDRSIEYNKIKNVYNYLTKSQEFNQYNLESLRIQSESIKNIKINPQIKHNTQLQLNNKLRVYGYSQQVKEMIIKLKLQQKYKDTLKMIDKIINRNNEVTYRDRMFGNHVNYIKKVKSQILKCQENKDYRGMFQKYMIMLQYGNKEEKIQTIKNLGILNYERGKEEKIEQIIRVNCIEINKEKIKYFLQLMDQKDQKRDNIITEKNLDGEMAEIYKYHGNYKKALQYFSKCVKMYISFYGQQHPSVADSYNDIAVIYKTMGKYDKAFLYYTKSAIMKILFYGQQHPSVAVTYNNIAVVYQHMGKYQKALQYYTKSVNIQISLYGQQHPFVAQIYNNLTIIYDSMGKYEKALKYQTKSINMKITFHGQQHPSIADSYNNIGLIYQNMRKYKIALQYYTKSVNMQISFYGQQHPAVADTYNNIANLYSNLKFSEKALQYYTKSVNLKILLFGQQHPSIADTYYNISSHFFSHLNSTESLKYCNKSIKIRSNLSLIEYPQLAPSYHLLSNIFLLKNRHIKSLHYEYSALDTFLKFHSIDNQNSPYYLSLLADIYYKMNRFIQSYFFYHLSYKILVKYFPNHDTNLRNSKHMMNKIKKSIPSLIYNYTKNIQFINDISSKYTQVLKHKLIKLLLAKKWQLKFEQQHRNSIGNFQYLKCVIEIYLCYKYLGYPTQIKKASDQMNQQLLRLDQSQQKSIFRDFIYKISRE